MKIRKYKNAKKRLAKRIKAFNESKKQGTTKPGSLKK